MRIKRSRSFLIAATIALCVATTVAQDQVFNDPTVDYGFTLPSDTWKMVVKPSATNPNVEYVYGLRNDGYLAVRKIPVAANAVLSDVVQDEAQSVQFKPGYVANKDENFSGKLRGSVFNFEYVAASKPMVGRYYFLRSDPTTVYVLRFTGLKDSMRSIRPQTDSIARTFGVRK
ncbi:MAG TPA: hypothetical protein VGO43_06485 [Pyrinomonadaceae bacterium]|jgi:hypothetical protein|nr:hypothetical protein [Pyrinomonadaceae bacterium]